MPTLYIQIDFGVVAVIIHTFSEQLPMRWMETDDAFSRHRSPSGSDSHEVWSHMNCKGEGESRERWREREGRREGA
jgi:hypothetical protein